MSDYIAIKKLAHKSMYPHSLALHDSGAHKIYQAIWVFLAEKTELIMLCTIYNLLESISLYVCQERVFTSFKIAIAAGFGHIFYNGFHALGNAGRRSSINIVVVENCY